MRTTARTCPVVIFVVAAGAFFLASDGATAVARDRDRGLRREPGGERAGEQGGAGAGGSPRGRQGYGGVHGRAERIEHGFTIV